LPKRGRSTKYAAIRPVLADSRRGSGI
jgi:hypothetical protein